MSALEFGKAAIRLSLLSDGIEKQLNAFEARLEKFGKKFINVGKSFSLVGGAIIAPFAAGLKAFTEFGSKIDDMSQRTGFAAESLQELEYAAKQSGSSVESVEGAVSGTAAMLLMAGRGNKKAVANLKELGVSLGDLAGLSPEEKFLKLADAVSKIEDPLKRGAIAEKVFGGAGHDLLPLLSTGASGIRQLMTEGKNVAGVLSNEDVAASAKLDDAFDRLWSTIKMFTVQLGATIAGPMLNFVNAVQPIVKWIGDWIKNNQTLVAWLAGIGVVLLGIGTVLVATGTITLFVAKAINVCKIAVIGVTWAVKALSTAVIFLCKNPLVALIAVIAAVIIYVLYATGVLGKLFHWIGKIVGVTDDATDSAENFNDALSKMKTPDIDFNKLKAGMNVDMDATAKGGTKEAGKVQSLFDVSLARQTLGDANVQEAQLTELKRVNKNLERQKQGVPVT